MEIVRFTSFVVRLALLLVLLGELKSCTIEMFGLSAQATKRGIMSYSDFNRQLTK